MFRFFKKKEKKTRSIYDCMECSSGKYRLVDPSKIDQESAHLYKCDRCGNKALFNPSKKYN